MIPGRRILIVDDNPEIHAVMRRILLPSAERDPELARLEQELFDSPPQAESTAVPLTIESAYQGSEAVRMVETRPPYFLTFVDMRMPPGIDGLETIKQLWQRAPYLYAVICSAYSDHSWEEIARQLGDTANLLVLRKPFEPIEVRQIVAATARMNEILAALGASVTALEQSLLAHQAEARVHEARARAALEALGRPALIAAGGRIVAANQAAGGLLGVHSAGDLIDRPLSEHLKLEDGGSPRRSRGLLQPAGTEVEVSVAPLSAEVDAPTESLIVCDPLVAPGTRS